MGNTRKPTPKSQREISDNLINPYQNPENGSSMGNPNSPSDFRPITSKDQSGVDPDRSNKISFRGDSTKPFTVGLKDIDETIMYYFNHVIKPTVIQNGNKIKVPIIYGSPERWKSAQRDGYYKDKNGKIMAPLIMFKREGLEQNRSITNKLDANTPHLYTSWQKSYNNKNSYSNFDLLNNKIPTKQFIANVVPDYVTLTYKCTVQTYYVEQLNKIIEAINYAAGSYWGDKERFYFKSKIDSFSTVVELTQGQNRAVKSEFTLTINGYIIPDTIQKEMSSIKKYNSRSSIIMGIEIASTDEGFTEITSNPSTLFIECPPQPPPPTTQIDPEMINYLNTNVQRVGTFVNNTTITFPHGWIPSPQGFPPTSIDNFTIFCNGVLIEKTAILSFTEFAGVTTLVIDPLELGYDFSATDEIVAIGKFSS